MLRRCLIVWGPAVAALVGCGSNERTLHPPPLPSEARTLILSVASRSGGELQAFSIPGAVSFVEPSGATRVELLAYDESPEALGLTPGDVMAGVRCRPCALTSPRAAWSTTDLEADAWRQGAMSDGLRSALVADFERCGSCVPFETPIQIPLEGTDVIDHMLPDGPRSALAISGEGLHSRVGVDGSAERLCTLMDDERSFVVDADRDLLGRVVLIQHQLDSNDQILRFDPAAQDGGPCVLSSSTIAPADDVYQILASRTDPEVFFVRSNDGQLLRFDGAEWTVLGDGLIEVDGGTAAMAWVSSDTMLITLGSPEVYWLEGERLRREVIETPGFDVSITAVTVSPHLGPVLGSRDGLLTLVEGTWTYSKGRSNIQRVVSLTPYGQGVLYSVRTGVFGQYYEGVGYCPETGLGRPGGVEEVAVLEDGSVLLSSFSRIGEPSLAGLLRPVECTP